MGYYETMQVCKKWGHKITDMFDRGPQHRQEFCQKCGSRTTHTCEHCNTKIKGSYESDGIFFGGKGPEVPLNCHNCGKPYPWRNKLLLKKRAMQTVYPLKYLVDSIVSIFKK